jgi:hypothetical protein
MCSKFLANDLEGRIPLRPRILMRPFITIFLLTGLSPTWSYENNAIVYEQLSVSATASLTFRIALWRDPDLVLLSKRKEGDALKEKLALFAHRMAEQFGKELTARGFGDLTISLIQDYDRLKDERLNGSTYQIIHCDPAIYLLGKEFLESNEEEDPYQLVVEEIPPESQAIPEAVIWIRKDSTIQDLRDLRRHHIAVVHRYSLLGGALQRAYLSEDETHPLHEGLLEGAGDYDVTVCGSVSDALFRLATGLATEKPIEAAFLPRLAPGFLLVMREMGFSSPEDLPFRPLKSWQQPNLPGNSLLVHRELSHGNTQFLDDLQKFLTRERFPLRWKIPNFDLLTALKDSLDPILPVPRRIP